jgi:hypothetical protein
MSLGGSILDSGILVCAARSIPLIADLVAVSKCYFIIVLVRSWTWIPDPTVVGNAGDVTWADLISVTHI